MSAQPAKDFRIRHLREKLGGLYEFQALLGNGAFAKVYLVHNLRLGRLEALKVLSETHDSNSVFRFTQEAKLVASLDHPNIVKVHDHGEVDGIIWFSMHYIDGPTLRAELIAQGRFTPIAVIRLVIPLLGALGYSHQMGTVHRDIKPSNILLDRWGHPYLMDFGIAKSSTNVLETTTGNIMGTPAYVSPEHVQGKNVDGRSDLYSLAIAMYEMLAGRTPFKAETVLQTITMRLEEEPAPLSQHCPSIPPSLEAIVMRGMARRREDRYPHANAMHDALVELLDRQKDQQEMILMTSAPTPVAIESLPPSIPAAVDPGEIETVKMRRHPFEEKESPSEEPTPRTKRGLTWVASLATVLILAVTMILLSRIPQDTPVTSPPSAASSPIAGPEDGRLADESELGKRDGPRTLTTEPTTDLAVEPERTSPVTTMPSAPDPSLLETSKRTTESDSLSAEAQPTPTLSSPPLPPAPTVVRRPVTAPKIVSVAEPALTQRAACNGQSIILSLHISEDGNVLRSRILKEGPDLCTKAARLAAEAYIFEPARDSQGQPVAASTTINIRFPEVEE